VVTAQDISAACSRQLRVLVDRYGFDPPQAEQIGCETYVCFHRGNQTVSVAWEPGAVPIVELFYPPLVPSDRVVAWADRNGVSRARRIPRIRVPGGVNADDLAAFDQYFAEVAAALVKEEAEWLAA
jgi:hypothetical protein